MIQESRRGDRAHEVALLAGDHSRQRMARYVHVRHHVDRPDALPVSIGCFGATLDGDAGVGAEDVDATECGLDFADESRYVSFARHVALKWSRTDLRGNVVRERAVDVGDDDTACAFG